jgi:TPR repeat protein
MHEQGKGVEKADAGKALALYEEAAKDGVREAMSAVGRCYETGVGTSVNLEKAFFFWQMAAEAGDPPALSRMGLAEAEGQGRPVNLEAARGWLEKAAEAQDPRGLWLLSRFYDTGRGGLTVSVQKSVELCLQAANGGNTDAMQQMGEYYAAGRGFARDVVAAAGWYRLAADHGHAGAMAKLALCYLDGRGTQQNERAAMELAAVAARVGEPRAQYILGRIFEEGLGCAPNPVFGLAYHLRALKSGIKEAETAVKRLRGSLNRTAVLQAENLAAQTSFHVNPAPPPEAREKP